MQYDIKQDQVTTDNLFIHNTAEVSEKAILANGVAIWNWTKVREHSKIGMNTKVGQCVYVDLDVIIGERCKIQNGVQIYKGVFIENDVFIGPNVTFSNDKYPRAHNNNWEIVNTYVKNGASIGAGSVIICGVTIGENAMIAAGSVVTKDVPANSLVCGNPARVIGMVDVNGKRISHE